MSTHLHCTSPTPHSPPPPPHTPPHSPTPHTLSHRLRYPQSMLTPAHLLLATTLSPLDSFHSRPKTRTPQADLVFRLSPIANIGESYTVSRIDHSSTAHIAVKLPLRA